MSDNKYSVRSTTTGAGLNKHTTTVYSITDASGNTRSVSYSSRSAFEKFSLGFGVFRLVILLLLVMALMRTLLGTGSLSFAGFLDFLANVPSVDMTLASYTVIESVGDWGAFNFLAIFINAFIGILNFLLYIFKGLAQVLVYVSYFLKFLFVA